jgi:hypothetical protein
MLKFSIQHFNIIFDEKEIMKKEIKIYLAE